jgi:hypothetical protein
MTIGVSKSQVRFAFFIINKKREILSGGLKITSAGELGGKGIQ